MKFYYILVFFVVSLFFISSGLFSQDTISLVNNNSSKSSWSGSFKVEGSYQKGNTNKIFGMSKGEVKRADRLLESILTF